MATLMDFIMAQRGDQSDPRFAANQQAMQLQNMARAAEQPAASATGAIAPNLPPPMIRPPMLLGAPTPMLSAPEPRPTPMPMLVGQPMPSMPQPMAQPTPAAPMPSPRPAAPAGAPMQLAGGQPSVREGFMQRLLGGPNYQSNNMPVVMSPQGPMASGGFVPQSVNWGDPESAADFFRADQAARQLGLLG